MKFPELARFTDRALLLLRRMVGEDIRVAQGVLGQVGDEWVELRLDGHGDESGDSDDGRGIVQFAGSLEELSRESCRGFYFSISASQASSIFSWSGGTSTKATPMPIPGCT
jgi:hypothetical protein